MRQLFLLLFIASFPIYIFSQSDNDKEDFYFDVITFYDSKIDSARLDIYAAIPYERLNFINSDAKWATSFELSISVVDVETNTTITTINEIKNIFTGNYNEAQGESSQFALITKQIYIPVGNYRIRALLIDKIANIEYEKGRMITVIDFNKFDFVVSSIMLVSNVEESENTFVITPYISDNVGNLSEGYFIFFEVYNNKTDVENINVSIEIVDNENKQIVYSDYINKSVSNGINQLYIHIPTKINYGLKSNTLRVYIYNSDNVLTSEAEKKVEPIAAAQRSIRSISFVRNRIAGNISKSIRQLIYVATSKQIDTIEQGADDIEKLERLERFWKQLDPTPHTERNEAFEEYYARIDYADKNFKAYSEGWRSDKGHCYVVYGAPDNIERTNRSMADNRTYEYWTYYDNRKFIFVDVSNFGDFRLHSPSIITDKYEYKK